MQYIVFIEMFESNIKYKSVMPKTKLVGAEDPKINNSYKNDLYNRKQNQDIKRTYFKVRGKPLN